MVDVSAKTPKKFTTALTHATLTLRVICMNQWNNFFISTHELVLNYFQWHNSFRRNKCVACDITALSVCVYVSPYYLFFFISWGGT
jgi:ubiquitin C-terminal hydrolase